MTTKISITNRQKSLPIDRKLVRRCAREVLSRELPPERPPEDYHLSIVITDDREIAALNRTFLSREGPTDVLSFDLGGDLEAEKEGPDGEVVVSAETALAEAQRRKIDPQQELLRYIIHGILHLAGYDDDTPDRRRRMRRRENKYLASPE